MYLYSLIYCKYTVFFFTFDPFLLVVDSYWNVSQPTYSHLYTIFIASQQLTNTFPLQYILNCSRKLFPNLFPKIRRCRRRRGCAASYRFRGQRKRRPLRASVGLHRREGGVPFSSRHPTAPATTPEGSPCRTFCWSYRVISVVWNVPIKVLKVFFVIFVMKRRGDFWLCWLLVVV